ncbi:MAG TPA: TldD/PmbA family protein [Thermoanaerobaculia bacterium]|nr:TldD/PmbA family protein [Thermoanaerobaculia bacterium]
MSLTRDEARDIIRHALELSKADETQVSIEANREANLRYANNEVSTSGDVSDVVVTVQAAFGKRSGAASVNQFDMDSLTRAVRQAEETARFAPEDPEAMPLLGEQRYLDRTAYDEATAGATPEYRAGVARHAIDVGKKGKLVAAGFITNSGTVTALGNSRGLFAYDRRSRATFSNTVRTREGNGSGWAGTNADRIAQMNAPALIATAAEKAVLSRNPRTMDPGTYTVILEPAAVADLLLYLAFQFDARSADEGRSFFAKKGGGTKIGEKVVSDKVTLWTDPADPRAPEAIFTGQGMPTGRRTWVENGVLKSLVYSRFWAEKMKTEPVPSPVNILMKGGSGSIEDLIRSTPNAILVTRLWYIRFLDPQSVLLTGLTRDGVFKIERGRIRHPLRNFRFNDSPVSVLSQIDAMTREVRTRGSESEDFSVVCPAIRTRFTFSSLSDAV